MRHGFVVLCFFVVRLFYSFSCQVLCRVLFLIFAVRHVFAVRFGDSFPCANTLPCVFLVSHGKAGFDVRVTHGKELANGNSDFSGSA
jgi:hypothetical protein